MMTMTMVVVIHDEEVYEFDTVLGDVRVENALYMLLALYVSLVTNREKDMGEGRMSYFIGITSSNSVDGSYTPYADRERYIGCERCDSG